VTVLLSGKTTRFLQEGGLTSLTEFQPETTGGYRLTGPFEVSLVVTDSLGFTATSNEALVSIDPAMDPVASISLATSAS
jgi:hypothetical protein